MQAGIDFQIEKLKKLIPEHIYSLQNEDLAAALGELLIKNKQTIATAESCTGGYIAHLITKVVLIHKKATIYGDSLACYI